MKLLGKFLVGLFGLAGALFAWIVGGIGTFITLMGVSGLYFAEYDIQTFSMLGLGFAIVVGSVIIYNKLIGP